MSYDNEILVKVDGVSKKFCRDLKKSLWYGMCDVASELLPFSSNKEQGTKNKEHSSSLRDGEFWANKDISFELRRGECLGLIGHNGAGKTTLLKMLNGLIKPDAGIIEMRGRISALIALGAGFNPILTGRENIYVNGTILGMNTREVRRRIDQIIAFAEIDSSIDAPVQSYSSGMQARLGFAVAAHLDPDILLVDEILSVGDVSFQARCFNRMGEVKSDGAAIIFVSHNMHQVARFCDRGLYLKRGNISKIGGIDDTLASYIQDQNEQNYDRNRDATIVSITTPNQQELDINSISHASSGAEIGSFGGNPHDGLKLTIFYTLKRISPLFVCQEMTIRDRDGLLFQTSSINEGVDILLQPGEGSIELDLPDIRSQNDIIDISTSIWNKERTTILAWIRDIKIEFKGSSLSLGRSLLSPKWKISNTRGTQISYNTQSSQSEQL